MANYFYKSGEREVGPIDAASLRSLADARVITPATMVRREDGNRWVQAAKLRGLFNSVSQRQPDGVQSAPETRIEQQNVGTNVRSQPDFGRARSSKVRNLAAIASVGLLVGCGVWVYASGIFASNSPINTASSAHSELSGDTTENQTSSPAQAKNAPILEVPFDYRALGIKQPELGAMIKIQPNGEYNIVASTGKATEKPEGAPKTIDFKKARIPTPPEGYFVQVLYGGDWWIIDENWNVHDQFNGERSIEDVDPFVIVNGKIAPDAPLGGWVVLTSAGDFKVYESTGELADPQPISVPVEGMMIGSVTLDKAKLPTEGERKLFPPRYVDQPRREFDPREELLRRFKQQQSKPTDQSAMSGQDSVASRFAAGGGSIVRQDPTKKTPAALARERAIKREAAAAAEKERKMKLAAAAAEKERKELAAYRERVRKQISDNPERFLLLVTSVPNPADERRPRAVGRLFDTRTFKPDREFAEIDDLQLIRELSEWNNRDLKRNRIAQPKCHGADSPLSRHLDGQKDAINYESTTPDGRVLIRFGHNAITLHDLVTGDYRIVPAFANFEREGDPGAALDVSLDLFRDSRNVNGGVWLDNRHLAMRTDTAEIAVLDIGNAELKVLDAGIGRYQGELITVEPWLSANRPVGPYTAVSGLVKSGGNLVFWNPLALKEPTKKFSWPLEPIPPRDKSRGVMFQLNPVTGELARLPETASGAMWISDQRYLYCEQVQNPSARDRMYNLLIHDLPSGKFLPLAEEIPGLPNRFKKLGSRLLFSFGDTENWWMSAPIGSPAKNLNQSTGWNIVSLRIFERPSTSEIPNSDENAQSTTTPKSVFVRPKRSDDDWPESTTDWMQVARLLQGKPQPLRFRVWKAIEQVMRKHSATVDPVAYTRKLIADPRCASVKDSFRSADWMNDVLAENSNNPKDSRLDPALRDDRRLKRFINGYVSRIIATSDRKLTQSIQWAEELETQLAAVGSERDRVSNMTYEKVVQTKDLGLIQIWLRDRRIKELNLATERLKGLSSEEGQRALANELANRIIKDFDREFSADDIFDSSIASWLDRHTPEKEALMKHGTIRIGR